MSSIEAFVPAASINLTATMPSSPLQFRYSNSISEPSPAPQNMTCPGHVETCHGQHFRAKFTSPRTGVHSQCAAGCAWNALKKLISCVSPLFHPVEQPRHRHPGADSDPFPAFYNRIEVGCRSVARPRPAPQIANHTLLPAPSTWKDSPDSRTHLNSFARSRCDPMSAHMSALPPTFIVVLPARRSSKQIMVPSSKPGFTIPASGALMQPFSAAAFAQAQSFQRHPPR